MSPPVNPEDRAPPVGNAEGAGARSQFTISVEAPKPVLDYARRHLQQQEASEDRIAQAEKLTSSHYHASRARLAALGRDRPQLRAYTAAAQNAVDRAGLTDADMHLTEAETNAWRSPSRIDLRKERGEVALLFCEPGRAERHFSTAAGYLDSYVPEAAAELRNAAASALHRYTRAFGGDAEAAAISLFRKNLSYWKKERRPEKWAMTQNNLGNSLQEAALTASEALARAHLKDAVTAYKKALEVYTREKFSKQWGTVKGNLSAALGNLARRSKGDEASKLFAEAAEAGRDALSVRSRAAQPVKWAAAQSELSGALGAAAAGAKTEKGAKLMEESVRAAEEARDVFSQTKAPAHWATASNNLGNSLRAQASKEKNPALLPKAVSAYREALTALEGAGDAQEERRAAIRTNLALALTDYARSSDKDSAPRIAGEAAEAAKAALASRDVNQNPDAWASTLSALASAMLTEAQFRGRREAGRATELAQGAAKHCRKALGLDASSFSVSRRAEFQLLLAHALEISAGAASPEEARRLKKEARAAYGDAMLNIDQSTHAALWKSASEGRRRLS